MKLKYYNAVYNPKNLRPSVKSASSACQLFSGLLTQIRLQVLQIIFCYYFFKTVGIQHTMIFVAFANLADSLRSLRLKYFSE